MNIGLTVIVIIQQFYKKDQNFKKVTFQTQCGQVFIVALPVIINPEKATLTGKIGVFFF